MDRYIGSLKSLDSKRNGAELVWKSQKAFFVSHCNTLLAYELFKSKIDLNMYCCESGIVGSNAMKSCVAFGAALFHCCKMRRDLEVEKSLLWRLGRAHITL